MKSSRPAEVRGVVVYRGRGAFVVVIARQPVSSSSICADAIVKQYMLTLDRVAMAITKLLRKQ